MKMYEGTMENRLYFSTMSTLSYLHLSVYTFAFLWRCRYCCRHFHIYVAVFALTEPVSHFWILILLISINIIFHLLCRWRCHWSMTSVARIHFCKVCVCVFGCVYPACLLACLPGCARSADKVILLFNVHKIQIIILFQLLDCRCDMSTFAPL